MRILIHPFNLTLTASNPPLNMISNGGLNKSASRLAFALIGEVPLGDEDDDDEPPPPPDAAAAAAAAAKGG